MDSYVQAGLKPVDALHVACAATAGADYFITTDKRILNKTIYGVKLADPVEFIRILEDQQ